MNIAVACLIADRIRDGEPLDAAPETWTGPDGKPLAPEVLAAVAASGDAEVRAALTLVAVAAAGAELTLRSARRWDELIVPYLGRGMDLEAVRQAMSPLERAELDDLRALVQGLPHHTKASGTLPTAPKGVDQTVTRTTRKEPTMGKKKKRKAAAAARYSAGLLISAALNESAQGDESDLYKKGFRDGFLTAYGVNPDNAEPLL